MAGMKMSNSSWKKQLSEKLKSHVRRVDQRIAIVGIGAELNGDDAVGLLTARKLKSVFAQQENLLVLEGGTLPESTSGPLRRFSPGLVIFIDAADQGDPPGRISFIDVKSIGGSSFSTHSMPLSLMIEFLAEELNCGMLLIGVQPEHIDFGLPLSQSGRRAVNRLVKALKEQFLNTRPE